MIGIDNLQKGESYMGKGFLAAFVTLLVGLMTMSVFTGAEEVGIVVSVSVMGAFIIYFNEKKK